MRGVVLAGGKGTRMGELTRVTNKHLLPVGKWPMVCHPLRKLVHAGVRDVLIVTGTEHMGDFVELLGSGKDYGCHLTYRVQDEAGGIAQALHLAEDFSHGESVVVLLGDNIFQDELLIGDHGNSACIYLKRVSDPHRYGVAVFSEAGVEVIIEKPTEPPSDFAVTGVYVFPPDVFSVIENLVPSHRGEYEITDVNNHYLRTGRMKSQVMAGYWTDAGTVESYLHANALVSSEPPQGCGY